MATIDIKTKNSVDVEKKRRVWFTCHPADFDEYFEKICQDLFATHDCAIYYTPDMTETIAPEMQETDMGRHNLFVVPVTFKLLSTPNRAMDVDIPYALQKHIPVLPIMMEPGLDELYSKPDKFGELQYLNSHSTDTTEISYEAKLKKYLESVLISDAVANRVRAAFDAYIFLSYRKKDRRFANELMRLIHSDPQCRDIAIWFDEFLTPGESFKANIEKALDDSKLFTLLVTPQLLEKGNYVLSTELPLARQKRAEKGTEILAVEMESTDPEGLRAIEIEDYIHCEDAQFRERLLEAMAKIATTENDTPEHNYLIGLAYLEGIDVEVDRERGIELITAAAESDLFEAMQKLFYIYYCGEGIPIDYEEALKWAKRVKDVCMEHFGQEHMETVEAMENVAYCQYHLQGLYPRRDLADLWEKIWWLRCQLQGKAHPDTVDAQIRAAEAYQAAGWEAYALERYKTAYALRCKTLGQDHKKALTLLPEMAKAYEKLGDKNKAAELYEKACADYGRVFGIDHQDTCSLRNDLVIFYSQTGAGEKAKALILQEYERLCQAGTEPAAAIKRLVGLTMMYAGYGDNNITLELCQKAYKLRRELSGDVHPDTQETRNFISCCYRSMGDHRSAIAIWEEEYDRCCQVYGQDHPDTLQALFAVTDAYFWARDGAKVLELRQKVYDRQSRILGPAHPETIVALSNVADAMQDDAERLALYQEAYKLNCQVQGSEDEDSMRLLFNLAATYETMGYSRTALTICERLCTYWGIEEERPKYYIPGSEYAAASIESYDALLIRQMRARLREKLQ